MDLRSTLMLLKVEAFLGANPLMKLNGTKLTLSKITYAVQAFYGSFLIINTVMVIFNIFNRMFASNGSNIPQFWFSILLGKVFSQLMLFVFHIKNITKGRLFSNMLKDICRIQHSKVRLDGRINKGWICIIAPQLCIVIVYTCVYTITRPGFSVVIISNLVTIIPTAAMYGTMTAILLCFKQTYKKINNRMESMSCKHGLDDSEFAKRISALAWYYRSMRAAVDCFNDFYGITIFLQLAATVFAVLGWLSQVTLAYLPIDVYTCVIPPKAICSIVIILCCDSVLEEAEKSIFISLALSERLPWKSQKRTAVFSLIQTCKDYAPEFSVLGLFCIKRSTVLGLFNIVSTLMIVFVQSTKIE